MPNQTATVSGEFFFLTSLLNLMWAELNCVQEVRHHGKELCAASIQYQINLLNKSVKVQNGFIPTRKYEYGMASRTRKYVYGMASNSIQFVQTCPNTSHETDTWIDMVNSVYILIISCKGGVKPCIRILRGITSPQKY